MKKTQRPVVMIHKQCIMWLVPMCNIIITLYQLADGEEGMLLYKTRYSSYKIRSGLHT